MARKPTPADAYAPQGEASVPVGTPAAAVRLLKTFGFVDAFGDTWHWTPGQVVRNPFVISMLTERCAPVTETE